VNIWLEQAVKYFTLPDVGGPRRAGVTPPNDRFSPRRAPGLRQLLVSGNFRYRYLGDRVRPSVDDFPSCNLFVRTDILKAINGYRTDFWPGEDTILCADVVLGQKKRIVYDPWAQVYHHRRPLFGPHLRQIGRYALHRGHFAKRFPSTSLRLSYLIPSLFVAGVAAGLPLAFLHPWLRAAYVASLALYVALTLLSSFSLSPAFGSPPAGRDRHTPRLRSALRPRPLAAESLQVRPDTPRKRSEPSCPERPHRAATSPPPFFLPGPPLPEEVTATRLPPPSTSLPEPPRMFATPPGSPPSASNSGHKLGRAGLERLRFEADQMIPFPVSVRELEGRRLLGVSRRVLHRVSVLALAFRLTGSRPYLDRAAGEMRAAAAFKDWNPSHFLDVAEMTLPSR
jgi:hypothetical protein